jgi:hypothetical protein
MLSSVYVWWDLSKVESIDADASVNISLVLDEWEGAAFQQVAVQVRCHTRRVLELRSVLRWLVQDNLDNVYSIRLRDYFAVSDLNFFVDLVLCKFCCTLALAPLCSEARWTRTCPT